MKKLVYLGNATISRDKFFMISLSMQS